MPYIVRPKRVRTGVAAGCCALLAFGAASAQAASTKPAETSHCEAAALSQPFLSAGDSSYYMLAPGQMPEDFAGQGWALSGGAAVKQAALPDGHTGSVLDLPSGAKAVSPAFCVTAEYPRARVMVRDLVGSQGTFFYVGYQGTNTWEAPRNTGQVHGNGSQWTLSDPVNMQPEQVSGWQMVRITLVAGGTSSNFELDDLWIDPYKR